MKKILTSLAFLAFSIPAYSQGIGEVYQTVKSQAVDVFQGEKEPVTSDTAYKDVKRPTWEIAARLNVIDTPNGGKSQFRTENIDVVVQHNLSSTLFAYGWYGNRSVTKNEFEGQAFKADWTNRYC